MKGTELFKPVGPANMFNPELMAMLPLCMMKSVRFVLIKFGGGIVGMSGSIAGNTFARNRSGNYMRARTKPVNPNTSRQVQMRSVIAYLAEYWEDTITTQQRADWGVYASNVAMKNGLGETIYLSGYNHFIRSNSVRHMQHLTIIAAAPTNFSLADKDAFFALDADSSPQTLTITLNYGMDWNSETGAFMHIRQGRPQQGTRNFFAGPYRNVGVILGSGTPWDAPVPFTPVFTIAAGQHQWVSGRIHRLDGRVSEMFYADAIVHGQAIGEVPNLLGMTEVEAVALLTSPEVQLILGTITTENHATVPVDRIISTDPVAHTRLNAGDPVNLVVSLGPAA
ncbi:hypothetical protein ES703_99203 [subsurface metagenome]